MTKREAEALSKFVKSDLPKLAASLQVKLFQLFLNGKSCEEIRRLNPQLTLGQIVHARIDGQWDERLQEYRDEMLSVAAARQMQLRLESADFIGDVIAAAHLEFGDKIKRYLQTRDPSELGDLRITTLAGYKTAIEMLMKITGQDKAQEAPGFNAPATAAAAAAGAAAGAVIASKAPNVAEAADMLALLVNRQKQEN